MRKYGITDLHWAAITKSIFEAGDLLNRGVDVHKTTLSASRRSSEDEKEISGVTALFCAARSGHAAMVELLLEHGAVEDILKPGSKGDTSLHAAALSGDLEVMQLMLQALASVPRKGRAVDEKGHKKRTPLHYAAGLGDLRIVKALLQAGADKSAKDASGAIPLHFAAGWGNNVECIDQLLGTSDSCVNEATDDKDWTALHYAAANGQVNIVKWLLNKHANINAVDKHHGNAPLHLAARRPDIVNALISAGADIWLENKYKENAIGLAHKQKDSAAVRAHIQAIQEVMPRDVVDPFENHGKNGSTLLHYVSAYGTEKDMAWIVNLSAFQEEITSSRVGEDFKVNVRDNDGQTALHWAAAFHNFHALRMLTENRAELDVLDNEDRSVLCLAIAHSESASDMAFIHSFLALPTVRPQIQRWVNHDEAIGWMKEYYVVHNLQTSMVSRLWKLRGTRAIMRHRIGKVLQQLRKLISVPRKRTASVQRSKSFSSKSTFKEPRLSPRSGSAYHMMNDLPPIYLALHAKRDDIARFIQEHVRGLAWQDAAINWKSEETERTALHWATILGESDIVSNLCTDKLYSEYLKPNVEDRYGKTPLQYAKEMNQAGMEKQLLERKDVKNHLEGLYRDRQVYVDAANAVLVAAALIASVTFAGWLQPPLNYVSYYDMPLQGAPDGSYASYAAVKQYVGVDVFWSFNSLSFTFAIATVLAGLVGVVPIPNRYIATTVVHLRKTLWVASIMLALSIVFVLGAFAAAGFTVLPPIFKYRANMVGTFALGGLPCVLLLGWFLGILCISRERPPPEPFSEPPPPPPPPRRHVPSRSRPWEIDDHIAWSSFP
ncbi:hypothetical protein KP509_35G021300 [Ceratopteris richardii]|nr:hypothetical protein KP509_35G021300 [Ceratopteris richardii]